MRSLATAFVVLTLAGCSGDDSGSSGKTSGPGGSAGGGGEGGSPAMGDCTLGQTQCDQDRLQTCTEEGTWSEPADCPGEQACRETACADPTPAQYEQADAASFYLAELVGNTAWHMPIDAAAIEADARSAILQGDGSDASYYRAMRAIHRAVPQGHQGLSNNRCNTPEMYGATSSRFGVCARPYQDHLIVTFVRAGNALGLAAGDRIIRAGEDTGEAILEAAAARPLCGTSAPSEAFRKGEAATSFFGSVPAAMELEVQPVSGAAYTLTVPDTHDATPTNCQDPLGRDMSFNAQSYLRPDGIGVVRVPRFFPLGFSLPVNPTQQEIDELINTMMQAVVDAFDQVKSAPQLIWDARSNFGGVTLVGLEIAGGMPTATQTTLSSCQVRVPYSDPPAFSGGTAFYSVTPGGQLAYSGEVAVLIDQLDYSAADYFPLAVRRATSTLLVGSPTAGAFGGVGPSFDIPAMPPMFASADPFKCSDAMGTPLEGSSVMPDMVVEYEPTDLAAGIDTVMEAAASALLSQ